jgi:hypothetical protein
VKSARSVRVGTRLEKSFAFRLRQIFLSPLWLTARGNGANMAFGSCDAGRLRAPACGEPLEATSARPSKLFQAVLAS